MDFYYFLWKVAPIYIAEIVAALAGIYYLNKNQTVNKEEIILVFYLWFVVLIESLSAIPALAYFTDYEYFGFVKGTFMQRNNWLGNIFSVLSFSFLMYYFNAKNTFNKIRKGLTVVNLFYLVAGLALMTNPEILFSERYIYTILSGTLLVFITIMVFYMQLAQSDMILQLKTYLPFYVSIGVLIFYLCITPVDIYLGYFTLENDLFIRFKSNMYLYMNLFLYGIITTGFIICSRKKKFY